MLRIRKNCNKQTDFEEETNKLMGRLLKRGYKRQKKLYPQKEKRKKKNKKGRKNKRSQRKKAMMESGSGISC